jgi:anti-sigma factor RsiW
MRCKRIVALLSPYVDDALSESHKRAVEQHLRACEACRAQLERIRQLGNLLDDLPIPCVPEGFAARVMAEAKTRLPVTKSKWVLLPVIWDPLRWFAEFSAPMRLATCATVLLACVVGLTMDGDLLVDEQGQVKGSAKNLNGLEWFDPTPPGSVSSVYLAMTTPFNEEGNMR